MFNKLPFQ